MRKVYYLLNTLIFVAGILLFFTLYRGGQNRIQMFGSTYQLWVYWQPAILLMSLIIAKTLLKWRHQKTSFHKHAPVLLFCGLLIIFLANGKALGATDTIATRFLPLSILHEGNFDLNEFYRLYQNGDPSYMLHIGGHYISSYPVGSAILAVPLYIPTAFGNRDVSFGFVNRLEKLPAAVFVAASAVFLYASLCLYTTPIIAFLLSLIYALGTSSLSVSSQALWQHGASQLCICAGIYCLAKASKGNDRYAGFAGFPLSIAVLCRPTDALIAAPVAIYVFLYHRKAIIAFFISALPAVLFQTIYNYVYLNTFSPIVVLAAGASETPIHSAHLWSTPFWTGFCGLLFSPARGLFIYSPIFLFSIAGCLILRKSNVRLMKFFIIGVALVIVVYSKWYVWWGGETYGPRLLADITPVLTLFLIPFGILLQKNATSTLKKEGGRLLLKILFVSCAAFSVLAHAIGAFAADPFWDRRNHIDQNHAALWQWKDNPLINPMRNLVVRKLAKLQQFPNSRTAPELLNASYVMQLDRIEGANRDPIELSFLASNTGKAIWLSKNNKAGVRLVCEWAYADNRPVREKQKFYNLDYDIYINQSYQWRVAVEPPQQPGNYHLLVGLATGKVRFPNQTMQRTAIDVNVLPGGGWHAADLSQTK